MCFISGTFKQKQPPKGIPRKMCSKNMQQIYRRTSMPKCDFRKQPCLSAILIKLQSQATLLKLYVDMGVLL